MNTISGGRRTFGWLLLVGVLILAVQIAPLTLFSQTASSTPTVLTQEETEEAMRLLAEIKQQRFQLDENEAKIAVKLAAIADDVRQTRIFAARSTRK